MQANLKPLLDVLGKSDTQYVIPVFQRVYSWTRQQCQQLWIDMVEANEHKAMHFMGMFLSIPEKDEKATMATTSTLAGASKKTSIERVSIIDGQQRLTTMTLLLIALRDALHAQNSEQSIAKANEIDNTFLKTLKGECKLILSEQDQLVLEHLVLGKELPKDVEETSFLLTNFRHFREKIDSELGLPAEILPALETLVVIGVDLDSADAPQQVFESLNSKGKALSTTDLIRNTLLVKFGSSEEVDLFEKYWTPLDEEFAQFGKEQDIYLDAALHQWITSQDKTIDIPKRTDLYQAFKKYIRDVDDDSLCDMLQSINESCLIFVNNPKTEEAKQHIDWALDKPKGLVSSRKLFGD